MPIYKPKDYDAVIDRINSKIAQLGIVMGEKVSERELLEFEEICNIRLPEAYRRFLQEVGVGCKMIDGFCLNSLKDMERKDLARVEIM